MKFNKIYIEITNICNLNCSFCSRDNREKREMTYDEFLYILKDVKKYTKQIYLHIKGEPLLHKELDKILFLCDKEEINVKMTTNGVFLKEKKDILLNHQCLKQINISLHSENKKENYFKDIFDTSILLSKKIPVVYRIWTLTDLKLNKLSTNIVDKIVDYFHLDKEIVDKIIIDKNIKISDNIYLDKDLEFVWPDNNSDSDNQKGTCLGTRSHIAILSNGDVVPCCLDSNAHLLLGNIFSNSLEEILNKESFKKIHEGFKNNQLTNNICKNCSYRIMKANK